MGCRNHSAAEERSQGKNHALSAIERQDLELPGADTTFTARIQESVPISVRPKNLAP